MEISRNGLTLLTEWEGGIKNKVYYDAAGLPTIGVGHLLTKSELASGKIDILGFKFHDYLSDDQCMKIFHNDLFDAEDTVDSLVTVHLEQYQFDAMVSFVFNVGRSAFFNSTLLKILNIRQYDKVPEQLRRWNRAGDRVVQGLINRREKEIKLWENG